MLSTIESVNSAVNNFIWGVPAMICIIGVGLYLSIRTGFLQIRKFPYAMKVTIGRMLRKRDASDGALTPFQAVCTALAATVGTGNIAGVESSDPFRLTHNANSECVLNYEIMNNGESIQNGTWYSNGFLFNLFTGAGQEATDQLRLNRNQLYNRDLSIWGGQYTGTLNFYTKIVDVHAQ